MKAVLNGTELIISNMTSDQYAIVRNFGGMRWDKSHQCMRGPATLDALNSLCVFGKLPSLLENERLRLKDISEAINRERYADNPVPLVKYPVNKALFAHQIRGANMALIAFGIRG